MLLWALAIGYLSVLSLAAGWALVERARSAIVKRTLSRESPAEQPGELAPDRESPEAPGPLSGPAGALSVDAV
jgi:hypothetical protein